MPCPEPVWNICTLRILFCTMLKLWSIEKNWCPLFLRWIWNYLQKSHMSSNLDFLNTVTWLCNIWPVYLLRRENRKIWLPDHSIFSCGSLKFRVEIWDMTSRRETRTCEFHVKCLIPKWPIFAIFIRNEFPNFSPDGGSGIGFVQFLSAD